MVTINGNKIHFNSTWVIDINSDNDCSVKTRNSIEGTGVFYFEATITALEGIYGLLIGYGNEDVPANGRSVGRQANSIPITYDALVYCGGNLSIYVLVK